MRLKLMIIGTLFSLMLLVACANLKMPTDKGMNSVTVDVPREMNNADNDSAITREGAIIVSLSSDGKWYIGKDAFSEKDTGTFRYKITELLKGKAGDVSSEKMIYFQGSASTEYGQLANILDEIRSAEALNIGLIVGKKAANQSGAALQRFAVKLPPVPRESDDIKPNPLLLLVEIKADGKINLGRDDMYSISNLDLLADKMKTILEDRDAHNIKDKSITIKAERRVRYGDVAKVIDVIKGAGGNPIILAIDGLN